MSWELIADVEPGFEWRTLETPLIGEQTLRVEQDWSYAGPFPGKAYATIAQQFPDDSLYGFRRFYPYRNPRLFTSTIPDFLETAGWSVYRLRVKHNLYARYQADANWRFRIYQWTGTQPPAITADPGIGLNDPAIPDLIYDGGQEI